jgi:hypothetical protein
VAASAVGLIVSSGLNGRLVFLGGRVDHLLHVLHAVTAGRGLPIANPLHRHRRQADALALAHYSAARTAVAVGRLLGHAGAEGPPNKTRRPWPPGLFHLRILSAAPLSSVRTGCGVLVELLLEPVARGFRNVADLLLNGAERLTGGCG